MECKGNHLCLRPFNAERVPPCYKSAKLGHLVIRPTARRAFLRVAAEGAVGVVEWRLWWRVVQVSLMQTSCGWLLLFIALGGGCSVPSRKNKMQRRPTDLQGRSQHTINAESTHSQHTQFGANAMNARSTHGQHTVNTRSTHGQHTVNTRSTYGQHTVNIQKI